MNIINKINKYDQNVNIKLTFVDPDRINYKSVSLRIFKGRAFLDFI